MQERARFTASMTITSATLTYVDGSERTFTGDAARAIKLKLRDRPNAIGIDRVVDEDLVRRGTDKLRLGGEEALQIASRFGEAHIETSSLAILEEPVVQLGQIQREVVRLHVNYTITVRRLTDA